MIIYSGHLKILKRKFFKYPAILPKSNSPKMIMKMFIYITLLLLLPEISKMWPWTWIHCWSIINWCRYLTYQKINMSIGQCISGADKSCTRRRSWLEENIIFNFFLFYHTVFSACDILPDILLAFPRVFIIDRKFSKKNAREKSISLQSKTITLGKRQQYIWQNFRSRKYTWLN